MATEEPTLGGMPMAFAWAWYAGSHLYPHSWPLKAVAMAPGGDGEV